MAYQNLYLRGGYFPTAGGNVSLVAGSALGGLAGYAGYGDQTGAKQGTLHTFLQV